MFRQFFVLLVISLWGVFVLPLPEQADATTPLTLAVIQNLRNLVQLMPQKKPRRQARKSDAIIPGDGLSTGRSALADLRFNDGSLARIGEQAVFRFLPKTRNVRLSTGTVLLLIPPGRGQTRINTPNAAAAIRGSGLFVRYDQETDTTIVGALTNSGIKVFNKDASQNQELQAGQLIVIVKGKFKGLYDFDLRTFYQTSDLVQGLDLTLKYGVPNSDPAIASVQAETAAAVAAQSPVNGQGVVENPSFVKLTTTFPSSPNNNIIRDESPVDTLLETGQVLSNTGEQSGNRDRRNPNPNPRNDSGSGQPPLDDKKPVQEQPPSNPPTTTPPSNSPPSNPASSSSSPETSSSPTVTQPNPAVPSQPSSEPAPSSPPTTSQPTVTTPTGTTSPTPANPSTPPTTSQPSQETPVKPST
ncbi:FecR family protein [Mastigocladopsis repens]|uniref:FecR family protein n=1 Tax=Mastigocladopsis repens TaxID=221287 RepID=UPI0003752994|nr:FecR family protein [Mastigocladopsis repens]